MPAAGRCLFPSREAAFSLLSGQLQAWQNMNGLYCAYDARKLPNRSIASDRSRAQGSVTMRM